jgi:hypothetical protein
MKVVAHRLAVEGRVVVEDPMEAAWRLEVEHQMGEHSKEEAQLE